MEKFKKQLMRTHKDIVNRSIERNKQNQYYANKAATKRIDNQGTDLRSKKRNPNSWMNRYIQKEKKGSAPVQNKGSPMMRLKFESTEESISTGTRNTSF
jgi:hypothetical protein